MVDIIILLQVCGGSKLSKFNVGSFVIYQLGDGLTSFNKNSSANFSGEKKYHKDFQGVYFASICEKTLTWFVQLQTNHFKDFSRIFNDKLQFSRTKIYLINRHSLTPVDHPIGLNSSWSHLRFLVLQLLLITLFYTTFHCIASEVQKKHLK